MLDLDRLVKKAQSGSKQALEQLCRQMEAEIRVTLMRIINDPDLVDDLAQETYLRLLKSFKNISEPVKVKNFAAQIATHVIHDHFRELYKWKDRVVPRDSVRADMPDDEEAILKRIAVSEVISQVPNQIDRRLLELKLAGKNYREISQELSISTASAKMRYKRTLKYLRGKL